MITKSAIKIGSVVWKGKRHCDIIHLVATSCVGVYVDDNGKILKPVTGIHGFVTDKGKFLNRKQAAKHALKCGQVETGKAKIAHVFNGRELFSEDLW